jgi:hypothetical protein
MMAPARPAPGPNRDMPGPDAAADGFPPNARVCASICRIIPGMQHFAQIMPICQTKTDLTQLAVAPEV